MEQLCTVFQFLSVYFFRGIQVGLPKYDGIQMRLDYKNISYQCHLFSISLLIYSSDNDKPGVSISIEVPIQPIDNVTLTCMPITTDHVTAFRWYKGYELIARITTRTTRTYMNLHYYSCPVNTTFTKTSISDVKEVFFL